jgi:ATP-dependent DNA helicase PIF1
MTQDEALDLLKLGENVFLTGAAGSGKTWLLNAYIDYLRAHNVTVAVTASTGIAATHLNGRTVHSWSGMGVRETLGDNDIEKLLRNRRVRRNYTGAGVLIIDEISMLHPRQLDTVDRIARHMLEPGRPFGGLQVVLCGDFFQLPPVARGGAEQGARFAFESRAWESGGFRVCYLQEQHRHGQDPLLAVLDDIRNGTAGERTKAPLRTRYRREPAGAMRPTRLYARNVNVDAINDAELDRLAGKTRLYTMESSGFGALVEGLRKSCLAPEELRLKAGAEVMFVKNASDGSYVNGTRGVVTGFDDETGWPLVRTRNDERIIASPAEWKYEENGVVRSSIIQIPLRLAWAITIHKSQGMTLDAAEIDLGDAFEPGMGYVALSRLRSLDGLKLMNLNETALRVHPDVLRQDVAFKQKSIDSGRYLQQFSVDEKKRRQQSVLLQRFKGSLDKRPAGSGQRAVKMPTHELTLQMLERKIPLDTIARERGLKPGTILNHIEKLKGLRRLPDIAYLKNALPQGDFDAILRELQKSNDGKLSPVHQKFGGRYSYEDLQLVRLFIE